MRRNRKNKKNKKKTSDLKNTTTISTKVIAQKCHEGPVEVVRNLFCGNWREVLKIVKPPHGLDTLVPLNDLDGSVWDSGFRGEILYYPIKDYEILPDDVLDDVVSKIIDRMESGKKVGLFCMGGHGRTGYVAAIVLGVLGYEDPIAFLRKVYCKNAVESQMQIKHIAAKLDMPELVDRYPVSFRSSYYGKWEFNDEFDPYDFSYMDNKEKKKKQCGDCYGNAMGRCAVFDTDVDGDDIACQLFTN